jgi:hypothetical protein
MHEDLPPLLLKAFMTTRSYNIYIVVYQFQKARNWRDGNYDRVLHTLHAKATSTASWSDYPISSTYSRVGSWGDCHDLLYRQFFEIPSKGWGNITITAQIEDVDITAELAYPLQQPKYLPFISFVPSIYFNSTFFQDLFDLILILL